MSTRSTAESAKLHERLRNELAPWAHGLEFSQVDVFADFIWDQRALDDVLRLEPASVIDAREGNGRAVIQDVGGELRCWLVTDRDPFGANVRGALGVAASLHDAVAMCVNFLVDGEPLDSVFARNARTPE